MTVFSKMSALSLATIATSVMAYLPVVDATMETRGRVGPEPTGPTQLYSRAETVGYSNKGAWKPDGVYKGDYAKFQGDTVSHGEFNGQKLWWWAKFYASGADLEPGKFAPQGGTSPWVLVNSLSASNNNGKAGYVWKGWNGQIDKITGLSAKLPTWRDGAEGAYTINLDDIGALPFDLSIQPAWDLCKEEKYKDIKMSWGVYVNKMTPDVWDKATDMVLDGHEMFNHSMMHTSAADQWQWFRPGQLIPAHDPSIPEELRNLKVVGTWGDPAAAPQYPVTGNRTKVFESPLVAIEATHYWTQNAPTSEQPGKVIEGVTVMKPVIYPKEGVKEITLPTGQKQFVKYFTPEMAKDSGFAGYIAATGSTWYESTEIEKFGGQYWKPSSPALLSEPKAWDQGKMWHGAGVGTIYSFNGGYWQALSDAPGTNPDASNAKWKNLGKLTIPYFSTEGSYVGPKWSGSTQNVAADKGAPGFVAKVWCVEKWKPTDYKLNIKDAMDQINKNIYSRIVTAGEYFRKGKQIEYYGYPFDAYSEVTHDSLESYGNVGARGGAKSGTPIPGDFFHPYRIDFDAFYIQKEDWKAGSKGAGYTFPDNPHVLLGLNELVDKIITTKGYMIRELHAVPDIAGTAWYESGVASEAWPLNSVAKGKGGWWGGITKSQLREHFDYIAPLIKSRKLTVYTPTEAVTYRLTANAVTGEPKIEQSGANYKLTVTAKDIAKKYQDEISVIVSLNSAVDSLGVKYDKDGSPRRKPVKMDEAGKIWSVSVNPYSGPATLIPNGKWEGQGVEKDKSSSIILGKGVNNGVSFKGIVNNQIVLSNLIAGDYKVSLLNAQGRKIAESDFTATDGISETGIKCGGLSYGVYFLNIVGNGKQISTRIMIK